MNNSWIKNIGPDIFEEVSFSIGDKVISRCVYVSGLNKFIEVDLDASPEEIEEQKMFHRRFSVPRKYEPGWSTMIGKKDE